MAFRDALRRVPRFIVILASIALFGYCLTQIAYVTPFSREVVSPNELTITSGFEELVYGWLSVVAGLVVLFFPIPFVIGVVATLVFNAKKWPVVTTITATVTIAAMFLTHVLCLFAWLANPLILAAWITYPKRAQTALILAIVALGLALSALNAGLVPLGLKDDKVPILSYGLGYWSWIGSIALVAIGAASSLILDRRPHFTVQELSKVPDSR